MTPFASPHSWSRGGSVGGAPMLDDGMLQPGIAARPAPPRHGGRLSQATTISTGSGARDLAPSEVRARRLGAVHVRLRRQLDRHAAERRCSTITSATAGYGTGRPAAVEINKVRPLCPLQ